MQRTTLKIEIATTVVLCATIQPQAVPTETDTYCGLQLSLSPFEGTFKFVCNLVPFPGIHSKAITFGLLETGSSHVVFIVCYIVLDYMDEEGLI